MDGTDSIQASISSILGEMKSNACWRAKFPFQSQLSLFKGQTLVESMYQEHDLNAYIGNTAYGHSCKLYFNPKSYPPPVQPPGQKLSGQDRVVLEQLQTDLLRSAYENGQSIIPNGSTGKATDCVFGCSRNRLHTKLGQGQCAEDYLRQSLHNNRAKNSCGSAGSCLARRTRTDKPTDAGLICHYRFTVKWDNHGYYYLSLSSGCVNHEHHPKLRAQDIPFRSCLTELHEQEIAASITAARVNDGAGCMVFQERVGHYISSRKFRHISRRNKRSQGSVSVANVTSMESLITTLRQSEEHSWAILYDEIVDIAENHEAEVAPDASTEQEVLIQETNVTPDLSELLQVPLEEIPEMTDVLDPDSTYVYADKGTRERLRVEMRQHAIEKRASLHSLSSNQKMVVAMAWGVNDAVGLFKMYPEVLYCDVTEDTNNEKRPLLTFSIRESHGKQIVFRNVLLPDEKACSF